MKSKLAVLALIILHLGVAEFVVANDIPYVFSPSGLTNDLSQQTVRQIHQDNRGYLWILTQEGLNRYDGRAIKIYRSEANNPNTLSENYTRGMLEGSNGDLWIATYGGGLNRYIAETDTFESIQKSRQIARSPLSDRIWTINKGLNDKIWIGYRDGGFSAFDPATRLFRHYTSEKWPILGDAPIIDIEQDKDGIVWIATRGNGLLKLDTDRDSIELVAAKSGAKYTLSSNMISDVHRDRSDYLWISTFDGGLYRIFRDDEVLRPVRNVLNPSAIELDPDKEKESLKVHRIYEDAQDRIFLATNNGVGIFHPDIQSIEMFTPKNSELSQNRVLSIYQDRTGRYWIGTFSGLDTGFESNFFLVNSELGLIEDTVLSITQSDDGATWVGTAGGLHRFAPNARFSTRNFGELQYFEGSNPPITSLLATDGFIWVGTYADGLDKLDPRTGKIERYRFDPNDKDSISSNAITSLLKDKYGNLWVGTFGGGINVLAPGAEHFRRLRHDSDDPSSLSNDTVYTLYQERSGDVWIGTDRGLNRYDYDVGSFDSFGHNKADYKSLSNDIVYSVYEDDDSRLWVGTAGGGLNMWEPFDRKRSISNFHHFQQNIELPSGTVYAIQGDDQGNIWLSTTGGITRLDFLTNDVKHYTVRDGLQSNDFNLGASFKDANGRMYFGGSKGFNAFLPEDVKDNRVSPPVALTRVALGNEQEWFDVPYDELEELMLEHTDYMVSFEFASLDFNEPSKNRYRYQMVGLNKSWVDLGNKNTVDFTNLPTGEYVFRVAGSNADGMWNEDGVSLRIVVKPPWYTSIWAFIFYFSVLLLLVLNWFRRAKEREADQLQYQAKLESDVLSRTQDLKRANEQLQGAVNQIGMARQDAVEANQAKSEFLAALSHEIRTPMHGVLGMTDLLLHSGMSERQTEFAKSAHGSATELLGLIDNILDFSKIEAGKLELEETTFNLRQVSEDLCYLYGEMAQVKNVELNLIFNAKLDRQMYGDPVRLRQVMQNLLSNAIKFTSQGSVTVVVDELQRNDKNLLLRFSVEDTGIGMDAATIERIFDAFAQADSSTTRQYGGTGLGLSIARQLIGLMGGELKVDSKVGIGTRMSVELSMNESPIYTDKISTDTFEGYFAEVVAESAETRAMFSSQLHVLPMRVRQCKVVDELSIHASDKRLVLVDVGALRAPAAVARVQSLADDAMTTLLLVVPLDMSGIPEELVAMPHTTKPLRSVSLVNDILAALSPGKTATTIAMEAPVMRFTQRVLLVEDMVANQEIARAMLESFGCQVDIANNGDVALEMYQHTAYDIILMDCQMPVMDGFEATRHIRRSEAQKESNERIPVVAVTAGKTEVEKDRCYGAGMDRILFKPYSTAELNGVFAHYFETDGEVEAEAVVTAVPVPEAVTDILDIKAIDNIRSVEVRSGNSLLAAVFENFRKDTLLKIDELRGSVGDATALASAAHAIASMSLNLGAKSLAVYGRKLEAEWKQGDIDDAAREIEVLHGHYLDAIKALEPLVQENIEQFEE
ncbi:hybrid sensor histidine kinase/response regulator [Halieaceae bacterium IMCC14734]|uniref:histidine kinase n=1 Tax=Candidatus Litorirhabdus singularis TaxID=2518993 RepID=A0ABT3TLQ9_9GAMM|nr:hybrid sensor histidine kinase/response regulator [Candidatus Litorirhabdus singularis]MCX2983261.1 hybrid sensor histidine kinase/response regulator [Candidatus Litorirhabdus singularis]